MSPEKQFDVAIIGAGLHGAAIAADCAGRGLRTLICHRGDVGGSHSLVSNRLFHYGLQYLQRGDFSRVTDSIEERYVLVNRAPHLAKPTHVVIPQPEKTSQFKLNTKAFLYKLIAGEENKISVSDITSTEHSTALKASNLQKAIKAVEFDDLIVNDARLVIENLLLAQEQGATILPHTTLISGTRSHGKWQMELLDSREDNSCFIEANCVINTTGPAADRVQKNVLGIVSRCSANAYQSGFIVVPKLYAEKHAYLIESSAADLIGVLPFMDEYSLVGPLVFACDTQERSQQPPDQVIEALLAFINRYFVRNLSKAEIVHSFATMGSSYRENPDDEPTPFSQDYVLDFNCSDGKSPSVTLFGACVNMHRQIAEQTIEQLHPYLPNLAEQKEHWTKEVKLPGARYTCDSQETFVLTMADEYPWLPVNLLQRYLDTYGQRTHQLLKGCKSIDDLGKEVVPGLYEKEALYLIEHEWAQDAEAILWHRTKLGLHLTNDEICAFSQWFSENYTYIPATSCLQLRSKMNKQAS